MKKVKRFLALFLVLAMVLQMTDYTKPAYAVSSKLSAKSVEETIIDYSNIDELIYSNQSTDEILKLLSRGLNLDTFFEGDLVRGTTKEDLLEWKSEGLDIRDVVRKRANERSEKVSYEPIYSDKIVGYDEEGNAIYEHLGTEYFANPSGDGKYYLTDCFLPDDKGTVNLAGTSYADALFNPKTGEIKTSTPWYITLGEDEAMCLTYNGGADTSTDHNYIVADINGLKNNPYFVGGSNYPAEDYLKGACYAYERILGIGTPGYNFRVPVGTLDANLQELNRKTSAAIVQYSGVHLNQAVLQIIAWRIAQGSFNPNNLEYEHNVASEVFAQMYDENSELGVEYAEHITHFYDYYALCAKECASGDYDEKYSTVQVKYWAVQGPNPTKWQDFMTWDAGTTVPVEYNFRVNKYGKLISNSKFENATFDIYSDSEYTNKIGELTTDSTGSATLNLVQGIYYLKEVVAPTGTILNNDKIILTVEDDVVDFDVTNQEISNGLVFQKYDSISSGLIEEPGKFELHEWVSGKNDYMKVCDITFTTVKIGNNVPAYSYYIPSGTSMTYHKADGTVAQTLMSDTFLYTPVNQGKYKIVETEAPKGYALKASGKTFNMNTTTDGYLNSFTTSSIGFNDEPLPFTVEIVKFDQFTNDVIEGAEFAIEEKIGNEWYRVGNLVRKERTVDGKTEVYYTTDENTYYLVHMTGGSAFRSYKGEYPLKRTTYNNGFFRIVETKSPDNYTNKVIKTFRANHTTANYTYKYNDANNGAANKGKGVKIETMKFDAITNETLGKDNQVKISVYEKNTKATDTWYKLGELVYNETRDVYELDSSVAYVPHKADGTESSLTPGQYYDKGYIYYTNVNEGNFKLVEEASSPNYINGMLNTDNTIEVYSKEFYITKDTTNLQVIDLTDFTNAAKDTGISTNAEVVKKDMITKQVVDTEAVFGVYESVNGEWLKVGTMKYDEATKTYYTVGMNMVLHDSTGSVVYTSVATEEFGLHYTTANKGKFKIIEEIEPANFTNSGFEQEFSVSEASGNKFSFTAYDLGNKASVSVSKLDEITKQKVKTGDAEFTVSEKIGTKWYKVGTLVYDEVTQTYKCNGATFTFHNADGSVIDTSAIPDFENGVLYYTTANKGQFSLKETKAPFNFKLSNYEKEFKVTTNDEEFDFTEIEYAAIDAPIEVPIEIAKYDAILKERVHLVDATFVVEEKIGTKWYEVATLKYNATKKAYTSEGITATYHNADGTVALTKKADTIAYTVLNDGKYRVVEKKAPTNYLVGSTQYVKEFTVSQTTGLNVDLTDYTNGAKNLGIKGTVSAKKYDAITDDLVNTGDTKVTVYEQINGKWYEMGILKYNSSTKKYVCDEVTFKYHNSKGQVIPESELSATVIPEYEIGKLYYTTANKGVFKIVETLPPNMYTLIHPLKGQFTQTFNITENNQHKNYDDLSQGIKNYGISVQLNVNKYDALTKQYTPEKNAIFKVQEYVNGQSKWMDVVTLSYDNTKNCYTTIGKEASFHDKDGEVAFTNNEGKLYYTTQNLGSFRVIEYAAPSYYLLGSEPYVKAFNLKDYNNGDVIDFTDINNSAVNIPIKGTVEVKKYDDVTKELVTTDDAEFTIYEKIGNEWMKVGVLKYDATTKSYKCDGATFTFHNPAGPYIDTTKDFVEGKLYYTSANKGQFKVKETKAPTNYTLGNFEKEFVINSDNETNPYTLYDNGAKNTGEHTKVSLLKYDSMTGKNVEFTNAKFVIEEKIGSNWLTVGTMVFNTTDKIYTTVGMNAKLHNTAGTEIYTSKEGKLYYTSANNGQYRVREASAPDFYILGSTSYVYEFNVLDSTDNLIDLTDKVKAPYNIGIKGTVEVAKFDKVSKEKVTATDAEFTVSEKIGDTWYPVGILKYNATSQTYVCDGVSFKFHNTDGSVIDTSKVKDFVAGKLYYTSANKGQFKVEETKAPANFTLGDFKKEFVIDSDNETNPYTDYEKGAKNDGKHTTLSLLKYDYLTKENIKFKNAKFVIEEKIGNEWVEVGTMLFDETAKIYTTVGMDAKLHNTSKEEVYTSKDGKLYLTSANNGQFRVREASSPANYILGSVPYIYEFNVNDSVNNVIDLTDKIIAPYNLGVSGVVNIAKYDKITKQKVETGDAEFTIYEFIGALNEWLPVGTLVYNEELEEYRCDGATFTFHNADGSIIDTSTILDFEEGKLYYTTANDGMYKCVETKSPSNYLLDGYEKEFNVGENSETSLTDENNVAYDTGFGGKTTIEKADKLTGELLAGAKFAVQEWSEIYQTWLDVAMLNDNGDGTYTSEGIDINIHTGNEAETVLTNSLRYTTQNKGQFRVIEKEAPPGYNNDMYVSEVINITKDGELVELVKDKQATDTPIRISVSKQSVTTAEIIGATLKVVDSEDKVIDTWVTDGKPHIIAAIKPGKYTLIEERASEGYIVASKVEFEVTETTEIQKVVMYDEEVKGQVEIIKEDKETSEKLKGAKFEIRDEEGKLIDTLVTDEKGYAISKEISFGIYAENGEYKGSKKYFITELEAPNGYELDKTPTEFTFEYIDDKTPVVVKEIKLTNEKTPVVQTGDTSDMVAYILLLFGAIITTITVTCAKKKEKNI